MNRAVSIVASKAAKACKTTITMTPSTGGRIEWRCCGDIRGDFGGAAGTRGTVAIIAGEAAEARIVSITICWIAHHSCHIG
jgi:hypothetical protein